MTRNHFPDTQSLLAIIAKKGSKPPLEQAGPDRLTADCTVSLEDVPDLDALEPTWIDLQGRARCSYFQSWGWVANWLHTLPSSAQPDLLSIRQGGRVVGLGLLGNRRVRRHRIFNSRMLLVSETGFPSYDRVTVEHNGLLLERGLEQKILRQCLRWLLRNRKGWDELIISGLDRSHVEPYTIAARDLRLNPLITADKPYYYVDLDTIRGSGGHYVDSLSRNTRYQLRRATRLYEDAGPINMRIARNPSEAAIFFHHLQQLHQAYWTARGQPGAFGTEFTKEFHLSLIQSRFSSGEVQLVEVRSGTESIGYLYNFVLDGVVSNYQSAFVYADDSRLKPGIVSHCAAIEYNLSHSMRIYDFLMGEQQYKRSLATHEERMLWLSLRRKRVKLIIEDLLREGRRRLRA